MFSLAGQQRQDAGNLRSFQVGFPGNFLMGLKKDTITELRAINTLDKSVHLWIRVYSRKEFNNPYPIIMKEFINKFIQIHSKFQMLHFAGHLSVFLKPCTMNNY